MPQLTWGPIEDRSVPLAVLVHGFPDTAHTWRHLGPALADAGWRVAAPWLRGYDGPVPEGPISAGTYAQDINTSYDDLGGDDRALLVGHDWGAISSYGAVAVAPGRWNRLVTLAVPPAQAIGRGLFGYAQARRSWYMWLIQSGNIAEAVMAGPDFWEHLWGDWSPGYDATEDVALLRGILETPGRLEALFRPYRAMQPAHQDPGAVAEHHATLVSPTVPTLYLHGADDGCMGADLCAGAADHLPAEGSRMVMVPGAGHFLHLERPHVIRDEVLGWLG